MKWCALLLLAACSREIEIEFPAVVYIPNQVSDAEAEALERGAYLWNAALAEAPPFDVRTGGPTAERCNSVYVIPATLDDIKAGTGFGGPELRHPCYAYVKYDPDKLTKAVFAHELGHVMGLGHTDDPNDMMYALGAQVDELSEADIAAARRVLGL